MPTYQSTTKSEGEIEAEFELAFRGIEPATGSAAATMEERLEPYRTAILKQHDRGLTWKQIAITMSGPIINVKVSERTLMRVFGGKAKKRRKKAAKRVAKPRPVVKPAAKPVAPLPPPPVRSVPEQPSNLPPEYQPFFDRAIVGIVRHGSLDDVAMIRLGEAT